MYFCSVSAARSLDSYSTGSGTTMVSAVSEESDNVDVEGGSHSPVSFHDDLDSLGAEVEMPYISDVNLQIHQEISTDKQG